MPSNIDLKWLNVDERKTENYRKKLCAAGQVAGQSECFPTPL
jgi:hypothetical protein